MKWKPKVEAGYYKGEEFRLVQITILNIWDDFPVGIGGFTILEIVVTKFHIGLYLNK